MNNLLSYCGLVDVRINASEKDLPVTDLPKSGGGGGTPGSNSPASDKVSCHATMLLHLEKKDSRYN